MLYVTNNNAQNSKYILLSYEPVLSMALCKYITFLQYFYFVPVLCLWIFGLRCSDLAVDLYRIKISQLNLLTELLYDICNVYNHFAIVLEHILIESQEHNIL